MSKVIQSGMVVKLNTIRFDLAVRPNYFKLGLIARFKRVKYGVTVRSKCFGSGLDGRLDG